MDLLDDSSDVGENIVGDKMSQSIAKFEGEFGTWQSGEKVFIIVFEDVIPVEIVLWALFGDCDETGKDEFSVAWKQFSKLAGDIISSGSKSRSKSNGDDGGDDSRGDGGEKQDDSNDCKLVKQFGTECIICKNIIR